MHLYSMEVDDGEFVGCQSKTRPTVHPPTDSFACAECRSLDGDSSSFDPVCSGCQELLYDESTSISQMFALLRQWTPRIQQNADMIIRQMLKNGAHVDDRDGLNDMTMLQYACKSGARGVGDVDVTCQLVELLLALGADPYIRCRWTNMAAIHYAAFFDVAPVVDLLLQRTKGIDVDSPCSEYDNGSPLHVAARNLALDSANVLLLHGAHPQSKDSLGKMPIDWVPDPLSFDCESEDSQLSAALRRLLSEAQPSPHTLHPFESNTSHDSLVADALESVGVKLGDRVVVGGAKTGVLRYCGKTLFASGLWAGVELDEAVGKNDGSVDGIPYFRCPPNYGIFAPLNKVSLLGSLLLAASHFSLQRLSHGKVDVAHVTSKIDTGLKQSRSHATLDDIQVGDKVLVAGRRSGFVRFIGSTEFAPGLWFGIELSKAVGKNDGSVNGRRYFSCAPHHGVFAPQSRIQKMYDGMASPASAETSTVSNGGSTARMSNTTTKPLLRSKTLGSIGRGSSQSIYYGINSSSNGDIKLTEGTTVFCSGEMGVVRYIGPVDFADGVWLGIELKTARGKHDGAVQGRRYFVCNPGHGLLVRPGRVSVRGINGALLRLD